MPLDITITPLYRVGGRERASLPGLMAAVAACVRPHEVPRSGSVDRRPSADREGCPFERGCDPDREPGRRGVLFHAGNHHGGSAQGCPAPSTNSYMIEIVRARARATTPLGSLRLLAVRESQNHPAPERADAGIRTERRGGQADRRFPLRSGPRIGQHDALLCQDRPAGRR